MKHRLTSAALALLLLLAAAAEALPLAPHVATGSSIRAGEGVASLVSLPAEHGAAGLVMAARAARQLARFGSIAARDADVGILAHATDPPPDSPPFHRKRPLPRATPDDSDSH